MTLQKAITTLEGELERHPAHSETDFYKAIQLGIEALRRIDDWRKGNVTNPDYKLPGETEE